MMAPVKGTSGSSLLEEHWGPATVIWVLLVGSSLSHGPLLVIRLIRNAALVERLSVRLRKLGWHVLGSERGVFLC